MPGARLVPTAVALAASACCARPAPALPTPPPLAGRARTLTFECQGADPAPASFPMTCALAGPASIFWPSIEPPRMLSPGVPILDPVGRPMTSCVSGIAICGVALRAPQGSRALACRAPDERFDGPVEVVAPDGSLLAQGYCAAGAAAGTWLWWERGELARTWAQPVTAHEGLRYTAPGTYTYGRHRLVPVSEAAR